MLIEVGKKYVPRSKAEVQYIEFTRNSWTNLFKGRITFVAHATPGYWEWTAEGLAVDGHKDWDLVAEYQGASIGRSCSLGCDIVDSGMKWSYCRQCEASFEFKNWEWRAMKRAT